MLCSVPCQYQGMNVAFHVDAGANNFYFAVFIQYQAGDGDLAAVELQQVFCIYIYIYIYTQVFRRRYIYDEREIYVRAGILCHIYDLLFVLFELMQGNSKSWQQMTHKWGVNWVLNSPNALQPPFSIRLTSLSGKKTLTANSVIPKNWQPNATYKSNVNYQ